MAHKIPQENIEVMMDAKTELVRFSPVSGNDFTDPSYHTPAFYRLTQAFAIKFSGKMPRLKVFFF
jgi:oligosaccharide reducing-end xylanase